PLIPDLLAAFTGEIQHAASLIDTFGKLSRIQNGAILIVKGSLSLIQSIRQLPAVLDRTVRIGDLSSAAGEEHIPKEGTAIQHRTIGIVLHAGSFPFPRQKLASIGQYPIMVQLTRAAVLSRQKLSCIGHLTIFGIEGSLPM